jgi:predicted GIY-YIG superfamily endonuclease
VNSSGSPLKKAKKSKGYIVYIAECREGTYITGLTRNLRQELKELNGEHSSSWYLCVHPGKKPVKILWSECNSSFPVAYLKWKYLKARHRKIREKIMASGQWPDGPISRRFLDMKDNLIHW